MFSRRHYEFLAALFRESAKDDKLTLSRLAEALKRDNPRFDTERFMVASLKVGGK
jgi:hypothetical protein